jgi:pyruvate/oxaloacetate carboxyltransferase
VNLPIIILEQIGGRRMANPAHIVNLVLNAVAVGMAVAGLVLGFLPGVTTVDTHIALLSIGLAAPAVAALQEEK